jgi:hypothetical protein
MRNVPDESFRENQTTHFMLTIFFRDTCRECDDVGKYGRVGEAADNDIIGGMLVAC